MPLSTQEIRDKTAQAFRRLPPKLQFAATLALIEEQPYNEIAGTLGISTGAVKRRVFRALPEAQNDAGFSVLVTAGISATQWDWAVT